VPARFARVLSYNDDWDWLSVDRENAEADYQRHKEHIEEMRRAVAEEFFVRYPDAADAVRALNEGLQGIVESRIQPQPWSFMEALSEVTANFAVRACEMIIETPECPLTPYFASLLSHVRATDVNRAITIARGAVETGDIRLCRTVAQGYWRGMGVKNLLADDVDLIKTLLSHTNLDVKRLAIGALGSLGHSQPQTAIEMAVTVDTGNSKELMRELCIILDAQSGIPRERLSDDDLQLLLEKLEQVSSIDDYHISGFLSYASKRRARSVVQLLLNRIERGEEGPERHYEPLPYGEFQPKLEGLDESHEYQNMLCDIRDRSLHPQSRARFWLPRLFQIAAAGYPPVSLTVLNEWINSGDAEKIEVASSLLRDAPSEFVFTHRGFVTTLLERAYATGEECYQKVNSDLFCSAISGGRSGSLGQPMPADVALREQAAAVARTFTMGSPGHRFYDLLVKYADGAIQDKLARDEELFC
jgi:hypothetical protein